MNQIIDLRLTTLRYPVPDFIYQRIQTYVQQSNRYHSQSQELITRLAEKHRLPPDHLFLTAGIDEAIHLISLTFGQHTTIFTPCYIEYHSPADFGHHVEQVPSISKNHYRIDPKYYPDTTLFFIANPNNPFGQTATSDITQLAFHNPQAMIVVDEAYSQFAPQLSMISLTMQFPNFIILRSFSKDYGLAGMRIGYLSASPTIINNLKDKVQWDNISYPAIGAANTALDHETYYRQLRLDILHHKSEFETFLTQHHYQLCPTSINATVINFPDPQQATEFVEKLKLQNILVNQGSGESNLGLDQNYVRIATGTAEEIEHVQSAISRLTLHPNKKA